VVLPGCGQAHALDVAERIRHAVCSVPVEADEHSVATSISIGVAMHGEGNGATLSQLIQQADNALYEAKRLGRNRVVMAGRPGSP
jgi:diguanylate cyclase (GGDEF)-like protein